ncbi:beta-glucosidase BglX [Arachidicoccus ginsenosidivorans]
MRYFPIHLSKALLLGKKPFALLCMATVSSLFLVLPNPIQAKTLDTAGAHFVHQLMQKMTLKEKIGQLNLSVMSGGAVTGTIMSHDIAAKIKSGQMGGIFGIWDPAQIKAVQKTAVDSSRLHIPLIFGLDVIHGHKTVFPVPLALSSTWDTSLLKKVARVAATEAAADGVNWIYSPMVDITRDPRWGRVVEGAGEDPFLGSQVARAMVEGYQGMGNDLAKNNTVMACVKHFALYGAAVAGREYNSVDMSPQQMFEYYLPPYKAAIDAGAGSVMTSFNDINGLPSTANSWLLTTLLRKKWGFNGFVTSDYGSVAELSTHGLGTPSEVAALALNAGTDMEMVGDLYIETIQKSVEQGKVSEATINQACERILMAKYKLGLFQNPYLYIDAQRAKTEELSPAHKALARQAASSTFVLLKNDQTLPLTAKGTIAVIGPLADSKVNMVGAWNIAGNPEDCITVLEGIKEATQGKANIIYEKGANITDDPLLKHRVNVFKKEISTDKRSATKMIQDAVRAANNADVILAVVGEAADMSGEAASRMHINIPKSQQKLLQALKATGKPLVIVLFNGRPLTLNWANENASALLDVWFPGTEAGNAVADVIFGKVNPSGKLSMSFPKSVGQVPIYYNHKRTGRPFNDTSSASKYKSDYLDGSNLPLYPFGYGLSYTTFRYGPVRVSDKVASASQHITATVKVTNTGKYKGTETVQLYITDPVARVTRSVQDLKGFKKVTLKPGESKDVSFIITPELLKYYDYNLNYDWDPGEFILRIGTNSRDTQAAVIHYKKD